ncbi:curli-like amyloid fiber formation chaperone CsgH [Chelativorans salis]|uniref:Curli-like amyloid fiber formation chaperone CsgH n=1 Tax=Chelativorans salis TaxID=2978478 RepID=A0ABT2LNU9_9HYPH|nr:curli-like amyloid fiber formation chaperone CsgH [Chelativorans sp. EGI FJ00035]MCT7374854.1 curli-like amyloid fiber formation chaperone CsgH [Chelativorans sp. EGI FJ00035]
MLQNRTHAATAAALALAISGTALMAGSGKAGFLTAGSEDTRCEILASTEGGMIALQGVVHAKVAMSGSYSFRVETVGGSGSSNIKQGGSFSAAPGKPAELGRVMLGGSGAVYEATLEVEAPDGRFTCSKRAGHL